MLSFQNLPCFLFQNFLDLTLLKSSVSLALFQGFHRYSTDRHWHVPHFEKMLYDQGQLACLFADAFQVKLLSDFLKHLMAFSPSYFLCFIFMVLLQTSKDTKYADTLRDILLYVMRDLSHKVQPIL